MQLNLYFPATGNQTDRQSNLQPLLAWADSVLQKVSPRAWILLGTDANAKACLQTDHSGLWVAQSSSAVGSLHQGQLDFNGNFFSSFLERNDLVLVNTFAGTGQSTWAGFSWGPWAPRLGGFPWPRSGFGPFGLGCPGPFGWALGPLRL